MRKGYAHHKGMAALNVGTTTVNVRQLWMLTIGLTDRRIGKTFRAGHCHYAHPDSFINSLPEKGWQDKSLYLRACNSMMISRDMDWHKTTNKDVNFMFLKDFIDVS